MYLSECISFSLSFLCLCLSQALAESSTAFSLRVGPRLFASRLLRLRLRPAPLLLFLMLPLLWRRRRCLERCASRALLSLLVLLLVYLSLTRFACATFKSFRRSIASACSWAQLIAVTSRLITSLIPNEHDAD
jgi:hypothetical protein